MLTREKQKHRHFRVPDQTAFYQTKTKHERF